MMNTIRLRAILSLIMKKLSHIAVIYKDVTPTNATIQPKTAAHKPKSKIRELEL